jgi:hypothetical protein
MPIASGCHTAGTIGILTLGATLRFEARRSAARHWAPVTIPCQVDWHCESFFSDAKEGRRDSATASQARASSQSAAGSCSTT